MGEILSFQYRQHGTKYLFLGQCRVGRDIGEQGAPGIPFSPKKLNLIILFALAPIHTDRPLYSGSLRPDSAEFFMG